MGTKRLYDFIDDNPLVHFLRIENINDPAIVKQNPKVSTALTKYIIIVTIN
jgi:4-hydroxybutyrate CoA-transferase